MRRGSAAGDHWTVCSAGMRERRPPGPRRSVMPMTLLPLDHEGGVIERVTFTAAAPTARISASPMAGAVPLTVAFDGTGSTDPNQGGTLSYAWDLTGSGVCGDSTSPTPSHMYSTAGAVMLGCRSPIRSAGWSGTTTNPDYARVDPSDADHRHASGLADLGRRRRDPVQRPREGQSGNSIPASGLTWTVILHHCPSNCHKAAWSRLVRKLDCPRFEGNTRGSDAPLRIGGRELQFEIRGIFAVRGGERSGREAGGRLDDVRATAVGSTPATPTPVHDD